MSTKPILCLDFDGVLHSYGSGWQGADVVTDPPVPGAMAFLARAVELARVAIFSSRSLQPGGLQAMQEWTAQHLEIELVDGHKIYAQLEWPLEKPPALVALDDRAVTFTGTFPDPAELLAFKPWNKLPQSAPAPRPTALLESALVRWQRHDQLGLTGEETLWQVSAAIDALVLARISEALVPLVPGGQITEVPA